MNATQNIIDILTACGCKPAATIDKNGDQIIQVNAPFVVSVDTLCDSDLIEYEYTQERDA